MLLLSLAVVVVVMVGVGWGRAEGEQGSRINAESGRSTGDMEQHKLVSREQDNIERSNNVT